MRALPGHSMPIIGERSILLACRRTGIVLHQGITRLVAPQIAMVLMIIIANSFTGCCSPCYLAGRTLIGEPSRYSIRVDRKRSLSLYRTWADQEWQQVADSCAVDCPLTPDYRAGFVTGFVDFVYAGGSGEPAPIPPREYWNISQRSPQGKERVNQWFSGYRHGTRVAHDGGYREAGTIQLSLAESSENETSEWTSARSDSTAVTTPHEESLPAPKSANPSVNRPSPTMRPRSSTSPSSTAPDNPFREDEPSSSNSDVPPQPHAKAPRIWEVNEDQRLDDAPAELKLPTEPLELPAAEAETPAPIQQRAPTQRQTSTLADVAVAEAARESSRNSEALAIAFADQSDAKDDKSSPNPVSGNTTTTLVVRTGGTFPLNAEDRKVPRDTATTPRATSPSESGRWRSVEATEVVRQPSEAGSVLRVSNDNESDSRETAY